MEEIICITQEESSDKPALSLERWMGTLKKKGNSSGICT